MFEQFNRRLETAKSILDLDVLVVQALFAPAVKAGLFETDDFSWAHSDCEDAEEAFIEDLPTLSQYYQNLNPVLSAAIWSIWDALNTIETPLVVFSWIPMSFSWLSKNRWTNRRRFILFRGVIATAAIRFSAGECSTAMVPRPIDDFGSYKEQVEAAIRNLSSVTHAA